MGQPDANFDYVLASEVEVGDLLEFPPPLRHFEVHAITRRPARRRLLWRAAVPELLTLWSDDRFREEVLKWGQEHFLITPGAARITLTPDSRVRRVLKHPRHGGMS